MINGVSVPLTQAEIDAIQAEWDAWDAGAAARAVPVTNRATITQHLTNEADALRTFRLAATPLTNANRDAALMRLAKDVEYLCRLAAAKFDHAD